MRRRAPCLLLVLFAAVAFAQGDSKPRKTVEEQARDWARAKDELLAALAELVGLNDKLSRVEEQLEPVRHRLERLRGEPESYQRDTALAAASAELRGLIEKLGYVDLKNRKNRLESRRRDASERAYDTGWAYALRLFEFVERLYLIERMPQAEEKRSEAKAVIDFLSKLPSPPPPVVPKKDDYRWPDHEEGRAALAAVFLEYERDCTRKQATLLDEKQVLDQESVRLERLIDRGYPRDRLEEMKTRVDRRLDEVTKLNKVYADSAALYRQWAAELREKSRKD